MSLVLTDEYDDVIHVTLNRPSQLNALSPDLLHELITVAERLAQHHAKLVTFQGSGQAFSAGADLPAFLQGMAGPDAAAIADIGRRAADALAALPQVTVAMIDGPCIGGGLVLASCCDLRWASSRSTFCLPEVKLGFPVGWGGTQRLSSVIGASATKHLTLECETLSAQQALHLGLIHRHFQDNFHEGAQEALGKLTPTPASTLRYTKSQFHAIETGSFDADRDAQAILKAGQNAEVLAHATANWRAKKTT